MIDIVYQLETLCREHNVSRSNIRIQLPEEAYELLKAQMSGHARLLGYHVDESFVKEVIHLRDVEIYLHKAEV